MMDIVACTDKWFIMPTGVMMQSVCQNNVDETIVFHVIVGENVSKEDKQDLEDLLKAYQGKSVVFYPSSDIDKEIETFPQDSRHLITKATYYRFYFAEILPGNIDKVLYLDGDLVVRHSLLPLWETDLQDYAIAAVHDMLEGDIEYYNRLKYPPHMGYFNAGVMLINLKYWRKNHVLDDLLDYIKHHAEDVRYFDQDIMNVVFRDRKMTLPVTYNLQHGFLWRKPMYDYWKYEKEVLEARKDPLIVHFTAFKPWYVNQKTLHPFRSSFYKYQDQTKWKGMRIDRRSLKTRLKDAIVKVLRQFKLIKPIRHKWIQISPVD